MKMLDVFFLLIFLMFAQEFTSYLYSSDFEKLVRRALNRYT